MKMIKKQLQNRIPYHSSFINDGIILNANESPYDLPKEVLDHMSDWAKSMPLNRYPDTDCIKLVEAIARKYNIKPSNVISGVGSDQLIDCLFRTFVDTDDYVLVPTPSFSMYTEYGELSNAKIIYIPLNEDFSYNLDNFKEKIKNAKITFICTPNNPTGSSLTLEEIKYLAKSTEGILAIDEAYGEFNDFTSIDLIKEFNNVIVFKTFSKAYGLAGARIGYALGNEELIDAMNIVKPPYNVNSFSIEAAAFVISNTHLYDEGIKEIKKERDILFNSLKELGVNVYPSKANFLWVELGNDVLDKLKEEKIYIRTFKGKYVRISIGKPSENKKLLEVIKCELQK